MLYFGIIKKDDFDTMKSWVETTFPDAMVTRECLHVMFINSTNKLCIRFRIDYENDGLPVMYKLRWGD